MAGVKIGVYGSASKYNGYTYTSSDGVQYQGIVANLPDAVHDDDAPPKEILNNYSLNWQFGVYESRLDDNIFKVLGYFVDDVTAPPTPPAPWNEAQGKNSVTLKWNHGTRPGATYTISSYDKTKANPYEVIGTVAGTETTFVCQDLIPNRRYSFVIHSTSADGKNSVYSDSVDVTTATDGPAPVIIKQPGNDDNLVYAKSGNPAVMSIIAEKYPEGGELSYQWQQHTDKGWENVKTPSASSPELTTENVTKAMDGRLYRCIVSQTIERNRIEAQSGAAELKVDADVIATETTVNVLLKGNPSQPVDKGNIAHTNPDTGEKETDGDALLLRARVDAEHSDDSLSGSLSFTIRKDREIVDKFPSQLTEEDEGLYSAVIEWTPTAVGNYEITAEYFGHEVFSGPSGITTYEAVDEKTSAYEHLEFGDDAEITYGDMLNLNDELKMYVYSMSESAPMDYSSVTYSVIGEDGEAVDDYVIEGYFVPKKTGEFKITASYKFLGDTYTAFKNVTVIKRDVTITCADISHDRSAPVVLPDEEDLIAINLMEEDELFTTVAGEKLWFYTPKTDIPVSNGRGKQGVYEISIIDNEPSVGAEELDEFNSAKELFLTNYNVTKKPASYTITGEEFHVKYSGSSNGTLSAVADSYGGTENPFNSGDSLPEGATLRFTATPNSGFIVGQWKINEQMLMDGEKAVNSNEYTIDELSADTSVEVKFVPDMHRLTYEAGDFGSLSAVYTGTTNEVASGSLLLSNTAITFTASPDTAGFIRQWIVNGVPVNGDDGQPYTGETYQISELLDDTYVSVSFGQKGKHLIETKMINEDGNTVFGNKLEVSGTGYDPDTEQAVDGSSVTFTATPGKNSIVYEWRQYTEDGKEQDKAGRNYDVLYGSNNIYHIDNVTSDLDIAAVFFCADDLAFGTSKVIEDSDDNDENNIIVSNLGHNIYEVRAPQTAVVKALSSNTKSLSSDTPVASVMLDETALQSCTGEGDLVITISVIDTGTLPLYLQNIVDDRPALAISVAVGERVLENFGGGVMVISVPYMLTGDENEDNVYVVCLPSGAVADVEAENGNLEFVMTAPGGFVVVHNPVDLKDVDDHIFGAAIKYAVSRGFISSDYEGLFQPEASVSRGMFIMGLGKRYGVNPDDYVDQLFSDDYSSEQYEDDYYGGGDENDPADSQSDVQDSGNYSVRPSDMDDMIDPSILPFSDVSPYDEAAPYILWAYQNGIIDGTEGDLFRPDDDATREEMAIILHNYAIFAGIPVTGSSDELRERAVEAAEHILGAKIMETLGNNYFEAKTNVSRAELSVSLQGLGGNSK